MAARAPWLASLSLHSHSHSAAATSFLIPCLRPRQVYASGQLKQCWFHSGFIGDACGSVLGLPVPDFAGFQSQSSRRRQWRNTGLATKAAAKGEAVTGLKNGGDIRVRFAPSPTGNLHVGGARTALFNYLFAKSQGGKFILRIEDTDLERSTRESEEAVLRDLKWLGLQWDEGPDNGGDYGPYRQSERNSIYRQYAEQLLESGHVYRCFCSDEELEAMREEAKADNRPPKYSGKWATANRDDVDAELAKGTPHTFRFRVPQSGTVTINDLIRGEVSWSKDTLGDFVILRSNGQPVYNFCVAVDDSSMKISHVIRAEEHLPNTLRQALIYEALGFPMPRFGHVSLILARDRSKLSKRHGATSVGQFKEMGYLPQAMVNYLALLGWNDGTEEELFTIDEIINKFSIDRITKSAAIFDQTKLSWMNGQHLKAIPQEDLVNAFGAQWVKAGILTETQGPFVNDLVELLKSGVELVPASEAALLDLLSYPLHSSLASAEAKELLDDNLKEVAEAVIAAYDSGELQAAIDGGHEAWQKWIKGLGKTFKRKGKRLFMPVRIALTGRMHGPDIGAAVAAIPKAERSNLIKVDSFVPLHQRISILREVNWDEVSAAASPAGTAVETEAVLTH